MFSEKKTEIDFSKELKKNILDLQRKIHEIKKINYKEKIHLEYVKNKNKIIFNDKKKDLVNKKKDLNAVFKKYKDKLDQKLKLFEKNLGNFKYVEEKKEEFENENEVVN